MYALHLNNPKCCSSDRLTAGTCICSGAIKDDRMYNNNDTSNDSDDGDYNDNDHSSDNSNTDGNNNNNNNAFQLMMS